MYPSFLKLAFEEVIRRDGLVVLAKGLGIELLFAKTIQHYIYLLRTVNASIPVAITFSSTKAATTIPTATSGVSRRKVVFVLNTGSNQPDIQQYLHSIGVMPLEMPLVITSDMPMTERRDVYSMGGLVFITSRILIIDLLKQNIFPEQVLGFLVYNAHLVVETSIETFVIRVCYEAAHHPMTNNSNRGTASEVGFSSTEKLAESGNCFIKAFTDSVDGLFSNRIHVNEQQVERSSRTADGVAGRSCPGPNSSSTSRDTTGVLTPASTPIVARNGTITVDTLLKNLFVTKVYPFPRFHQPVTDYFGDQSTLGVIECPLKISVLCKAVHSAILVAISQGLNELKKSVGLPISTAGNVESDNNIDNRSSTTEYTNHNDFCYSYLQKATIETVLYSNFDSSIRSSLQPRWFKLSIKTKSLIDDLHTLKELVESLLRYDAVSFYIRLVNKKSFNSRQQSQQGGRSASGTVNHGYSAPSMAGHTIGYSNNHQPAYWLSTYAGDEIFKRAKERIFKLVPTYGTPTSASVYPVDVHAEAEAEARTEPQAETIQMYRPILPPWWTEHNINERYRLNNKVLMPVGDLPSKWTLLINIITEIKAKVAASKSKNNANISAGFGTNHVIVVVRDDYTAGQLRDLLRMSDDGGAGRNFGGVASGHTNKLPMDNPIMLSRFRWYIGQQAAQIRADVRSAAWQHIQSKILQRQKELNPYSAKRRKTNHGSINSRVDGGMQTETEASAVDVDPDVDADADADVDVESVIGLAVSLEEMCCLTVEQRLILLHEKVMLWQDQQRGQAVAETEPTEPNTNTNSNTNSNSNSISDSDSDSNSSSDSNSGAIGGPKLTGDLLVDACCVTILTSSQLRSQPSLLDTMQPDNIVLYDADLRTMRQIELYHSMREHTHLKYVHAASVAREQNKTTEDGPAGVVALTRPSLGVSVYFLMFQGSVDEYRYIATVTKEKSLFHRLLNVNAGLCVALPDSQIELQIAKRENERDIVTDTRHFSSSDYMSMNMNIQGSSSSGLIQRQPLGFGAAAILNNQLEIVVDIREFRSFLPNALHGSGRFKLIPEVIFVGDYVLSNDIAIERKGINDLVQSLAGGRLYKQMVNMVKYYSKPCLLVEFTAQEPFQFLSSGEMSGDIQSISVTSRLCLYLMSFPSVSLLWARTPQMTTQIFCAMRRPSASLLGVPARGEVSVPIDVARVKLYGSNTCTYEDEEGGDGMNAHILSSSHRRPNTTKSQSHIGTLLTLPGISAQHIEPITSHVDHLMGFCNASQSELSSMLHTDSSGTGGSSVVTTNLANNLFALFHTKYISQH